MFNTLHWEDVPKLRRTDVKYTLQLLLRVVRRRAPHPATRATAQPAAGNSVKIGFLGQQIVLSGVSMSRVTCQHSMSRVTCPGLRVLLTCFGDNLTTEWLSIAATIRSGPAAQHRKQSIDSVK